MEAVEADSMEAVEADFAVAAPRVQAARLADHPSDPMAPLPRRPATTAGIPTPGPASIRIVLLQEIQRRLPLAADVRPAACRQDRMDSGIRLVRSPRQRQMEAVEQYAESVAGSGRPYRPAQFHVRVGRIINSKMTVSATGLPWRRLI